MKRIHFVVAIAATAFATVGYAADTAPSSNGASNEDQVQQRSSREEITPSKTRAQVYRELEEAEKSGEMQRLARTLYRGAR
ncbi:MAG: DUF4148 domain-containing protein [Paraburkholderia sp.]|jgi:hypothetical protein|uniref:DUF4148 domain-containing protein n=1 Tax=Paraburkholderia sp. TaxID=1926495 RepID=UPI0039788C86